LNSETKQEVIRRSSPETIKALKNFRKKLIINPTNGEYTWKFSIQHSPDLYYDKNSEEIP